MDIRNHTFLKTTLTGCALAATLALTVAAGAEETSLGERLRGLFGAGGESDAETILPVDEAFRFSAASAGPERLTLLWQVADGYYLYRDRFRFDVVEGEARIRSREVVLPAGRIKEDEAFGRVEVNTGEVVVELPLQRQRRDRSEAIVLQVAYQGCKEGSVCYPPVERDVSLTLQAAAKE